VECVPTDSRSASDGSSGEVEATPSNPSQSAPDGSMSSPAPSETPGRIGTDSLPDRNVDQPGETTGVPAPGAPSGVTGDTSGAGGSVESTPADQQPADGIRALW
jgi:hypothetical protein